MTKTKLLGWVAAGVLSALALCWAYPRAFPLMRFGWSLSRDQAQALALEKLRDLGAPVTDAYVVTRPRGADLVDDRRMELAAATLGVEALRASPLAARLETYAVSVYPPQAPPREWAYRATVTMDGRVISLQAQVPAERPGGMLDARVARANADEFLRQHGFDLAQFAEPEIRTEQLKARTDTRLSYRYKQQILGAGVHYGVDVTFAGDRLTGFAPFFDDADESALAASTQASTEFGLLRILIVFLLLPLVAVPFLRRYHAGEIGVRRGLQILAIVFGAGALLMVAASAGTTEGSNLGLLTRVQTTWVWGSLLTLLFFLPLGLVSLLSWSVGESFCRERWGHLLAAFDALFQGRWATATVARSALRGTVSGLAVAAGSCLAAVLLQGRGVMAPFWANYGPWWPESRWPGVSLLLSTLAFGLYGSLFGRLFLYPFLRRRLGPWLGGALVVVVGAFCLSDAPLSIFEQGWSLALSAATVLVFLLLFVHFDLLTSVLACVVATVSFSAMPLLLAHQPGLEFQGWLAMFGVCLPLLVSLRFILSDREFTYHYDDIPVHVRRIAERERQRVELETARNIQSSILPDLPPQLAGVEIAHTYLPATEVGGDFYDVLALEDGRLAVAVGDVAGHGVSSGLVMSMAKSALAVQVTFNPAVEAVFTTLNRMVFQTARKRLLATLCYALIDAERREMLYASAGHLYPYRVTKEGRVEALEAESYPLGVRLELAVQARVVKLDAGDSLVLYSDGIVEARREGGEEDFGFDRLEKSLAAHAGKGVRQLGDAVLADVEAFTRGAPREDDVTLLVLRMP